MSKDFRGDTFFRNYSVELDDGAYTFKDGDIIKVAFCDNEKLYLKKEIKLPAGEKEIDISWTAEEMATLEPKQYVLEVEIVALDFTITDQEVVIIDEDFIYGEE